IGKELAVVLRIVRVPGALLHPRLTAIRRAEEPGFVSLRRHRRVNRVCILWRQRERDTAEVDHRQSLRELVPGRATIGGLEDAGFRTAGYEHAGVPASLIRGGVHDIRIARIEQDIGDARVLADLERRLPRAAAIGRLVETAIAARRPERTLRRDPDDVAVPRIDRHATDLLRPFEADALPGSAGIRALEHAFAGAGAAQVRFLARREPDHARVLRIDEHTTHRIRAVVVEDRRERETAVRRLP